MTRVYIPTHTVMQRKTPGFGLFGMPGTGKGTLGGMLCSDSRVQSYSMGDAIREVRLGEDDLAHEVNAYYQRHGSTGLLSDALTKRVFDRSLERVAEDTIIAFDGIPRNVDQVPWVHESTHLHMGVYFVLEVQDDEAVKRMHKRGHEQKELMEAGKPHQFREEDLDPRACRHRLDVYKEQTLPVLDAVKHYGARVVSLPDHYTLQEKHKAVSNFLSILYPRAANW